MRQRDPYTHLSDRECRYALHFIVTRGWLTPVQFTSATAAARDAIRTTDAMKKAKADKD